jgi:hypothetical protein|tara:strand:- start:51 stop:308 length:258 start_codon:yes stop_codon:yes gene_type:complete
MENIRSNLNVINIFILLLIYFNIKLKKIPKLVKKLYDFTMFKILIISILAIGINNYPVPTILLTILFTITFTKIDYHNFKNEIKN